MTRPAFQIGPFAAPSPVLLAPMAGFTDAAMRRVCSRFGAGLTFTEMVNAAGVLHASDKTWHLLETLPGEGPVAAHLYGADPGVLGEAAGRVAATGRFVAVDLNAGCPVRKIASKGAGAALMRDPALAGRIVAAMHAATPLPITVKTRLGPRPDKVAVFELLDAVAAAGGAALTVHARFATQEHSGEVRLDLLAEVKRRSRIPVIGNGGVRRAGDIEAMFRETGVDAVMVAQAALGNPWIFQEAHFMKCDPEAGAKRDLDELRRVLQEHVDGTLELCRQIRSRHRLPARALPPEDAAAVTFRCQLFRYLRGLKGANYVRGRLHELRTLADIQRAVEGCLEREARYRALRLTPPERLTTMPAS